MSKPQLAAIIPCEDLTQSLSYPDRRLSLHRVFYDLLAPAFPATVGRLPVTMIFVGGAGRYSASVRLLDPAERALSVSEFQFTAQTFALHHAILGATLPMPGTYYVEVALEGEPQMRVPLAVVQTQPTADAGAA